MMNSKYAIPRTNSNPQQALEQQKRPRNGLRLAATMAALLFAASACGSADAGSETSSVGDVVPIQPSGDESDQAASADVTPSADDSADAADVADAPDVADVATGASGATIEDAQDAYRQFTDCMRNEGVQMPPAAFDAQGKIDLDAQLAYFQSLDPNEGASQDFADEAAAEEQCLPENADELLALISPDASAIEQVQTELTGELNTQLTAISKCMREQFPNFPDPQGFDFDLTADDEQGAVEFNPFPGIDTEDPLYAAPMEACAQAAGLAWTGG